MLPLCQPGLRLTDSPPHPQLETTLPVLPLVRTPSLTDGWEEEEGEPLGVGMRGTLLNSVSSFAKGKEAAGVIFGKLGIEKFGFGDLDSWVCFQDCVCLVCLLTSAKKQNSALGILAPF